MGGPLLRLDPRRLVRPAHRPSLNNSELSSKN